MLGQFVRIAHKVLFDHIPKRAKAFLDDVGIKGPKATYNNEELAPGIRRFVVEHIQNLDAVLADVERAGITIARAKSQFCYSGIKIVGFICDSDGRHPDTSKVLKNSRLANGTQDALFKILFFFSVNRFSIFFRKSYQCARNVIIFINVSIRMGWKSIPFNCRVIGWCYLLRNADPAG